MLDEILNKVGKSRRSLNIFGDRNLYIAESSRFDCMMVGATAGCASLLKPNCTLLRCHVVDCLVWEHSYTPTLI